MGSLALLVLSCLLLFAEPGAPESSQQWQQDFNKAEAAFNSRSQYSSVVLFQNLIDQILEVSKTRVLKETENLLLARSYDYLGQAFFNRQEFAKAYSSYSRLIRIRPEYRLNADLVSPKIVQFFSEVKEQESKNTDLPGPPSRPAEDPVTVSQKPAPAPPVSSPPPPAASSPASVTTAQPKAPEPQVVPSREADQGVAKVWFYRTGDTFSGSPSVFVDTNELGRLVKGRFFVAEIPSGTHTFRYQGLGYLQPGRAGVDTKVFRGESTVIVDAGKDYYVRIMFEKNSLIWSTGAAGQAAVADLKPSDPKDIKNPNLVKRP
jgi:hypothetical protein